MVEHLGVGYGLPRHLVIYLSDLSPETQYILFLFGISFIVDSQRCSTL